MREGDCTLLQGGGGFRGPPQEILRKIRTYLRYFQDQILTYIIEISYLVELFIFEWIVQIRAHTWSIFEWLLQIRAYTWSELLSVVV